MVALTIEEQIDALKNAWNELQRINYSSGFNMHHYPEVQDIVTFDEWNEINNTIFKLWQKLEDEI